MENDSIELSPKHGVNATILCCPCCCKEQGVAMLGKLKDDAEAPKYVADSKPCDKCQKVIDEGGRFFIEVDDDSPEGEPHRTGKYCAITGEAADRVFSVKTYPINFMLHSAYQEIFGDLKDTE